MTLGLRSPEDDHAATSHGRTPSAIGVLSLHPPPDHQPSPDEEKEPRIDPLKSCKDMFSEVPDDVLRKVSLFLELDCAIHLSMLSHRFCHYLNDTV